MSFTYFGMERWRWRGDQSGRNLKLTMWRQTGAEWNFLRKENCHWKTWWPMSLQNYVHREDDCEKVSFCGWRWRPHWTCSDLVGMEWRWWAELWEQPLLPPGLPVSFASLSEFVPSSTLYISLHSPSCELLGIGKLSDPPVHLPLALSSLEVFPPQNFINFLHFIPFCPHSSPLTHI